MEEQRQLLYNTRTYTVGSRVGAHQRSLGLVAKVVKGGSYPSPRRFKIVPILNWLEFLSHSNLGLVLGFQFRELAT